MSRSYTEFTTNELRYISDGLELVLKIERIEDIVDLKIRIDSQIRYRANKYGE